MWEKIAGAIIVVIAIPVMALIKGLGLPAFIMVPLVLACTIIFLMGNVFLFNGGEIIKKSQRVKTTSRAPSRRPSLASQ